MTRFIQNFAGNNKEMIVMRNREAAFMVTARQIKRYEAYLQEQERAGNTVRKYVHDLNAMLAFLDGRPPGPGGGVTADKLLL